MRLLQGQSTRATRPLLKTALDPEPRSTTQQRIKGMVFDIQRFAIHDGPGVRTVVFMKGCPLRCWWCQNPEGLSASKTLGYFEYRCMKSEMCIPSCPTHALSFDGNRLAINRKACDECGMCIDACPSGALTMAGREMNPEELVREIEKDVLLFDNSGGGVTFSGGEPLLQPAFLRRSLAMCKQKGMHTALETSGYASPKVFDSVIDLVDLFLFDLKLLDEADHKRYTGVSNGIIKRNLSTLVAKGRGGDVVLRFPVITGVNDTGKNIEEFLDFVRGLKGVKRVDLLPYHDVSEKYKRLGLTYKMSMHAAPSEARVGQIREKLEMIGLEVGVRG